MKDLNLMEKQPALQIERNAFEKKIIISYCNEESCVFPGFVFVVNLLLDLL
jgi:hypothetical protein